MISKPASKLSHAVALFCILISQQIIAVEGAIPELDGIWELNLAWTNHPNDIPAPYGRPSFREYTRPEVILEWDNQDPVDDPALACIPPTVATAMSGLHAIGFDQSGEHVTVYAEAFDIIRTVYMDGRDHPGPNAPHTNLGHSIGWYEGDTLVIDTSHISAGWKIATGNSPPNSEQLQVVERYRVIQEGTTLEQTVTVTDPLVLTQPVTYIQHERRAPFNELVPYDCMPLNTDRGDELTPEEFYRSIEN